MAVVKSIRFTFKLPNRAPDPRGRHREHIQAALRCREEWAAEGAGFGAATSHALAAASPLGSLAECRTIWRAAIYREESPEVRRSLPTLGVSSRGFSSLWRPVIRFRSPWARVVACSGIRAAGSRHVACGRQFGGASLRAMFFEHVAPCSRNNAGSVARSRSMNAPTRDFRPLTHTHPAPPDGCGARERTIPACAWNL